MIGPGVVGIRDSYAASKPQTVAHAGAVIGGAVKRQAGIRASAGVLRWRWGAGIKVWDAARDNSMVPMRD